LSVDNIYPESLTPSRGSKAIVHESVDAPGQISTGPKGAATGQRRYFGSVDKC
jgi:hypothetical protein